MVAPRLEDPRGSIQVAQSTSNKLISTNACSNRVYELVCVRETYFTESQDLLQTLVASLEDWIQD